MEPARSHSVLCRSLDHVVLQPPPQFVIVEPWSVLLADICSCQSSCCEFQSFSERATPAAATRNRFSGPRAWLRNLGERAINFSIL